MKRDLPIPMNRKELKIGYIWQYESSDLSPVSATALHMRAVVRGFEKRGHTVRIVTIRKWDPFWSENLTNWNPIEPRAGNSRPFLLAESLVRGMQKRLGLPYFRLFDSYRFSKACLMALQDCDILYERFWFLGYGGLFAAKKLRIPLIYEVNGDLIEEYAQLGIDLPATQWSVIHLMTQQMFQHAGRVVTVSEPLKERISERWKIQPEKISSVFNGADIELFANPNQERAIGIQDQLNHGAQVIMFVGSFKPWHGLDLLLQAFKEVSIENRDAKLVLVGDGPMRTELEEWTKAQGISTRVVFTGAIDQEKVAVLLKQAEVVVLNPRVTPASMSQCPLKLFEYMAAGKAIVAPRSPNISSILADRENALLVEPDHCQALAAGLRELLADNRLRETLGKTAQKQAIERHSWERTVGELEDIFYDELETKINGK
jgi:glycosyltransferase involved in cell wall biosynthesis